MTAFTDWMESAILALLFNATAIANIADNAASSPITNWYVALHTASAGEAGSDQSTNEASYGSYARVAVARTSGGFTIASGVLTFVSNVVFPTPTSGAGASLTHASIGIAASGATNFAFHGALSAPITVAVGVPPEIQAASQIALD